jgi:quercetin dioxygenase-like cupin family protein
MVAIVFCTFLALASVLSLQAQQAVEIKSTLLSKHDLSTPGREGIMVMAEFAPGARESRHTHPGDIFQYILEGTFTLHEDGQPTVTLKPGEVFFVPAGKVHWAENAGTTPLKLLVVLDLEKGKPMSSPAK